MSLLLFITSCLSCVPRLLYRLKKRSNHSSHLISSVFHRNWTGRVRYGSAVHQLGSDEVRISKPNNNNNTVIWEEPRRHPSRQRMDSPTAGASCTMLTPDESNHLAVGTIRTHRSYSETWCLAYNVAARRDFFLKSLLHFSNFLVNANFDLVTKYIFENHNNDSIDILSIRKYSKLFTHESNTSLLPTQPNGPEPSQTSTSTWGCEPI